MRKRRNLLEFLAVLSWRPLDKADRMGFCGIESATARIAETADNIYIVDTDLLSVINVKTMEETQYELRIVHSR